MNYQNLTEVSIESLRSIRVSDDNIVSPATIVSVPCSSNDAVCIRVDGRSTSVRYIYTVMYMYPAPVISNHDGVDDWRYILYIRLLNERSGAFNSWVYWRKKILPRGAYLSCVRNERISSY